MRFDYDDEIDKALVQVIIHEFLRCELAFNQFISLGWWSNNLDTSEVTKINMLRYNSYALFIQHLYEYLVACFKRDRLNTSDIKSFELDKLINFEVNKILENWITAIDNGFAPKWANNRSYYDDVCPEEFGRDFRTIRNSLSHADYRRIQGIDRITLSDFFKKYHKYVILLFQNAKYWWSIRDFSNIDLGDVTAFNKEIESFYKDKT